MQACDITASIGTQGQQPVLKMAGVTLEEFAALLKSMTTMVGRERSAVFVRQGHEKAGVPEETSKEKPARKDSDDGLLVNVMLPQTELPQVVEMSVDGNCESPVSVPVAVDESSGMGVVDGEKETVDRNVRGIPKEMEETASKDIGEMLQQQAVSGEVVIPGDGDKRPRGLAGRKGEHEIVPVSESNGGGRIKAEQGASERQSMTTFVDEKARTLGRSGTEIQSVAVEHRAERLKSDGKPVSVLPGDRVFTSTRSSKEGKEAITPNLAAAKVVEDVAAVVTEKKVPKKGLDEVAERSGAPTAVVAGGGDRSSCDRPEGRVTNGVDAAEAKTNNGQPSMFVERLTERLAGGELKFGFKSAESGELQVSTAVHNRVVEVGITAERQETVSALKAELPVLESHLREHSLRLGEAQISTSSTLSAQTQMGEQRRHQQEWKQATGHLCRDVVSAEKEPVRNVRSVEAGRTISLLA